ncbi:MAG: ABC transporter ATP-binding protein [Pyrobaculum sp.]
MEAASRPSLRAESIRKSFGKTQVLREVSVEVGRGEFFVILGPSGEGKSTFLNIVAGLVRPDGGRLWLEERLVEDSADVYIPPERRRVGYVFQNYALYPHMSAYDNIAFPLKMAKVPKAEIEKRVREVAAMLRLEDVLTKRPAQLSGGQRQRVALARALVKEPSVLLMDEPFSNIDAYLRERIMVETLDLVKKLNISTVMVTHNREEAAVLADRVAVLRRGTFLQIGPPEELFQRPCCLDVATFLGFNILTDGGRHLAFRPEDVSVGESGFRGRVIRSEFAGVYWVVYVSLNGTIVKAYLDRELKKDVEISLEVKRGVWLEN